MTVLPALPLAWLGLRKDLYARYQIPPAAELHSTKFIAGRGHPSTNPTPASARQGNTG